MLEEEKNWLAFKAGDKEAFARIFRMHYKALFQYGLKITANRESVQDGIQELFLELWRNKAGKAEVVSVKAYLFGALKLKLIKMEKSDRKKTGLAGHEESLFDVGYESVLIAEQTDSELKNKLASALKQLSKRQQEAIYLKYYGKMSYEEISETMSINYQASRNLVYQAMKVLRENLVIALVWVLLQNA